MLSQRKENVRQIVAIVLGSALVASFVVHVVGAKADEPRMPDIPNSPAISRALDLKDFFRRFKLERHSAVCGNDLPDGAHCNARVVIDSQGNPRAAVAPSGYGPAQFHSAYGLPTTATGSPIIAIVDAYDDPYIASDLATYSNTFGIPALPACKGPIASSATPCFQKVDQNGGTRYPFSNSGWALEIALDTEVAHAICQNCRLLLVEAKSSSYANLMAAVDRARLLGAKYISNSYGSGEFSGETAYDSHFNYPGIVFTFSAGDSGYGAEYPASSPYVTAVGGTTLALNTDNSYAGEIAWNGTGSGCSAYEAKPGWQTDPGCTNRTVADVSADADPSTGAAVYDSVRYAGMKGWFQVGGTSLSAPLVAATYALAQDVPSTQYANAVPYAATAGLNDVASGSNGSCGTYLCNAQLGYDGPTGLGSPAGLAAF